MSRDYLMSQHFLRNPRLALMLIGHSNLKKHDVVVEIGAGSGVITSALSKRVAKVIAIEPDPDAVFKLKTNLARQGCDNVEVVCGDFMKYRLPTETYKVFSNPPFHLSSAILHKLIEDNKTLYRNNKELKNKINKMAHNLDVYINDKNISG